MFDWEGAKNRIEDAINYAKQKEKEDYSINNELLASLLAQEVSKNIKFYVLEELNR